MYYSFEVKEAHMIFEEKYLLVNFDQRKKNKMNDLRKAVNIQFLSQFFLSGKVFV